MRSHDPFVGTWRDASQSSVRRDVTLFIARAGPGYKATLYILESDGGHSIVHVPLTRAGGKLTGGWSKRSSLAISRSGGGRIAVIGYDAPAEMVRASTAANPVFS